MKLIISPSQEELIMVLKEATKPLSTLEIASKLDQPYSTIKFNLWLLELNGLVRSKRKGKSKYWELAQLAPKQAEE